MTYEHDMLKAIEQAIDNYPFVGWFGATESATEDYDVSLPELQRAVAARLVDMD